MSKAPLIQSTAGSDPFWTIKDVLEGEIRSLRIKFEEWKASLNRVNTATDVMFKVNHEEFQKSLQKTEEACKKLKTAVANISKNRARFAHVDDKELERRQSIVSDLDSKLEAMRSVFFSRDTKAKMDADQRAELHKRAASEVDALRPGSSSASGSGLNSYQRSNDDYMRDQSQQQTQLRREQDEALGSLSSSLSRVNEMAVTIKTELQEQDKILDDIDKEMDVAQGKMDQAIGAIEKLLKTKDRCQLATIAILVIVFIVVAIIAFKMITK